MQQNIRGSIFTNRVLETKTINNYKSGLFQNVVCLTCAVIITGGKQFPSEHAWTGSKFKIFKILAQSGCN